MGEPGQAFEDGVKEWLHLADALLTSDVTSESRRTVTEQLAEVQRMLQTKQRQVETGLEEEIAKEDAVISRLQESLDGTGRGQAEQTEAYDMLPLWYNLKMVQWQDAYDALSDHNQGDTEKPVLDRLIAILKVTFDHCGAAVQRQRDGLQFAALFPGESQTGEHKLPKRRDKELDDHCRGCQVKTLQFCLPTVKRSIVNAILEDKRNTLLFRAPTDRIQEAMKNYIDACVEFSWVACLEEEPVQLVTNPRKECKSLLGQFNGEDEVPRTSYVEWPALVQNDVIRTAWQLFHRGRPGKQSGINETRSLVAKNVQARARNIENERVKGPRAVVYETDSDLDARSSQISRSSLSSMISQQSTKSRDSAVSHGHVHSWKPGRWQPSLSNENVDQRKLRPTNVSSKSQRSALEDIHSTVLLNSNRASVGNQESRVSRKVLPESASGSSEKSAQEGTSKGGLYESIKRSRNQSLASGTILSGSSPISENERPGENVKSAENPQRNDLPVNQRKSKRKSSKTVYLDF